MRGRSVDKRGAERIEGAGIAKDGADAGVNGAKRRCDVRLVAGRNAQSGDVNKQSARRLHSLAWHIIRGQGGKPIRDSFGNHHVVAAARRFGIT